MSEFIIFPSLDYSGVLDVSQFDPVFSDDPIRQILQHIPSFEKALSCIREDHFEGYGFFVQCRNPCNGSISMLSSLFFEKQRDFTITSGLYAGVRVEPIPPLRVYRRRKSVFVNCMPEQRTWMVERIMKDVLSDRSCTICFMAGGEMRSYQISPFIKKQICVQESDDCIPLLVLSNAQQSLDFAGIVMDLLHCCLQDEMVFILRETRLSKNMSVSRTRKLYDIFPEEYIQIPNHVWDFLRSIDESKLTPDDVDELKDYYLSC